MKALTAASMSLGCLLLVVFAAPQVSAQTTPAVNAVHITSVAGVDTNGNGLYDFLRVNFTMDVAAGGNFAIQTQILAEFPTSYVASSQTDVNLSAGTRQLTTTVLGARIYQSGLDGPYQVRVDAVAVADSGTFYDQAPYGGVDLATTSTMLHTDFEPPWAHLGSPITDSGVDTNGNGLYDFIVIHVPIVVVSRGPVQVSAYLQAGLGFGSIYLAAPSLEPRVLDPGTHTWDLRVGASMLRTSQQDGPYHGFLYLTLPGLENYNSTAYTTQYYSSNQFDWPSASLGSRVVEGTGLDTNGDGRADFYDFQIPVEVRTAGDYAVSLALYPGSFPWQSVSGALRLVRLMPGSQVVDLRISGVAMSRMNPTGNLQALLEVIRMDNLFLGSSTFVPYEGDVSRWTLPFPSVTFDARTTENLTIQMPSGGPPCISVEAVDPTTRFVQAGSSGYRYGGSGPVQLALYNGTFDVYISGCSGPQMIAAQQVTVSGPTTVVPTLPARASSELQLAVTPVAWNETHISVTTNMRSQSPFLRLIADMAGNFDGFADAGELQLAAELYLPLYAGFIPPLPGFASLTVRIDDTTLPVTSVANIRATGAGSTLSSSDVIVQSTLTLRSANDLGPAPHTMYVRVPYSDENASFHLRLDLSAFDVARVGGISRMGQYDSEGFTWDGNASLQARGGNIFDVSVGRTPSYLGAPVRFELQAVLTGGPHPSTVALVLVVALIAIPAVVVLGAGLFLARRSRKRSRGPPT